MFETLLRARHHHTCFKCTGCHSASCKACTAGFVHSHVTGEATEAHRRGRSLSTEQVVGQDRNPEKGGKQPGSSQERGKGSVTDVAGLHRVNTRLPARDGTLGRS